jgi:Ankyrin repeats (many copies)/Ankyrin repeat
MSNAFSSVPRSLPPSPDLRHLKEQAKDLLRAGTVKSLSDAQFAIAKIYGFASWPKLKTHVELLKEGGQLKQAIDSDDVDRVRQLMTDNPSLHKSALGYGRSGPLTWVAECRTSSGAPSPARLAIAEWMILNGSDVHQGGDAPLMRAALRGDRAQMMELLVAHGADVNARWNGSFPILFGPCETVDSTAIAWLLGHGADPQIRGSQGETALDYLLESYVRSGGLYACADALISAGVKSRYDVPGVLDIVRGRLDQVRARIDDTPGLLHRLSPELRFGATGTRRMTLQGATLLHLAAEFGATDAVHLLIAAGADVNVRATVDEREVGGQTPIYHAVTQFNDVGLSVTQALLEAGADLSIRARLPGSYENPDEVVDCTPLEYAQRFPGSAFPGSNSRTLLLISGWKNEFLHTG